MTLKLEELMSKDPNGLSDTEAEVIIAQIKAEEIRNTMESNGTPQTHGVWTTPDDYLAQNQDDLLLETQSLFLGYNALSSALAYLTVGKNTPLVEEQYLEIKQYAINHYPNTIWDNGLWSHRFDKVVREHKIPIHITLRSSIYENETRAIDAMINDHDETEHEHNILIDSTLSSQIYEKETSEFDAMTNNFPETDLRIE